MDPEKDRLQKIQLCYEWIQQASKQRREAEDKNSAEEIARMQTEDLIARLMLPKK